MCFFIGKSSLSKILSCDSIMDGAFFPQPDFQMPEEKVRHYTCQYVVVLADALVIK